MYYTTTRLAMVFLTCLVALCFTTFGSTASQQSGKFAGKMNEDIAVLGGTVKIQADKDREIYRIYIQRKGVNDVGKFETRFLNRKGEEIEPKEFRFADRVEVQWEIGEIPAGATGARAVVLKNLSR